MLKNRKPITFKLTGYQWRKEVDDFFKSPSFYTNPCGYHMYVAVNINGCDDGKGTHIAISLFLQKGHHDEELHWPLIGKATVTLLNQLADDNHHEVRIDLEVQRSGCMLPGAVLSKFIPHSRLVCDPERGTQYLKDNTLYFRVFVDVCGYRPWLKCTQE